MLLDGSLYNVMHDKYGDFWEDCGEQFMCERESRLKGENKNKILSLSKMISGLFGPCEQSVLYGELQLSPAFSWFVST